MKSEIISSREMLSQSSDFVRKQTDYNLREARSEPRFESKRKRNYNIRSIEGHCPPSWGGLMGKSLNGDKAAYSILLNEFEIWLYGYFGTPEFEDNRTELIPDVLLSAHRKLATVNQAQSILLWLLGIANYRVDHPTCTEQQHRIKHKFEMKAH